VPVMLRKGFKNSCRYGAALPRKAVRDRLCVRMRELTPSELKDFIDESMNNRHLPNKRVMIGTITADAQNRIEAVCGRKVKDIDTDRSGVIHALKKADHNLETEDLLLAVDVINTSTDIALSPDKNQNNDVLMFKKDIDGDITFLTEVRAGNGYLLVFNAWRQKKARSRRRSNAARRLQGAYVQNDSARDEP